MITKPQDICLEIESSLIKSGLYSKNSRLEGGVISWRISPEPYYLHPDEIAFFNDLGPHLLKFYEVLNRFYADSLKGKPIVIAATGGTDRHALVIDYQLRPILNYLKGVVVPSSVFVHSKEFEDEVVLNKNIRQRVKQIINELKGVIPFTERNALH